MSRLWINYTQKREDVGNQTVFIPHSKEENEFDGLFFIPFKLLYYYFILFVIFVFNKVFKTVSRVWFCCEHLLLKYRDSIDHFLELRSTIVLLNSRRFKVVPRAFSACRVEIQMSIRISDYHASICT